jgi:hypothetical protein
LISEARVVPKTPRVFGTAVTTAIVATAVVVLALSRAPAGQGGELAGARVSHVGIVTRDIDATLRDYVRVMGFAMPTVSTPSVPLPDNRKAEIKLATFYMPKFHVEVIQPSNDAGPYREHLQAHGMSIQHVGLALAGTGSVDAERASMVKEGGRWTLGSGGSNYAFVDFSSTLGTSLEVLRGGAAPPAPLPAPLFHHLER